MSPDQEKQPGNIALIMQPRRLLCIFFKVISLLLIIFELQIFGCDLVQNEDQYPKQVVFRKYEQKYLANHVMETKQAEFEFECGLLCARHESCTSINYKTSGTGKGRCELNNETHQERTDDDETSNPEFNHLVVIKPLKKEPGNVYSPILREREIVSSCKDLLLKKPSTPNGAYTLQLKTSSTPYEAYCHMTDIPGCGAGGWTLVLEVDGNKQTFTYESPYWTNNESYAVEDGLEGLTEKESKLASYWNTPFRKICLGMTVNGDRRWIVLNYEASSLYSLISDGKYRKTTAGRATWKSLIAGSSLQLYCNKEGFSIESTHYVTYARIGYHANNENDCATPDSCIGFGISYKACGVTSDITCGNIAPCSGNDNGEKLTPAFGYILVQ